MRSGLTVRVSAVGLCFELFKFKEYPHFPKKNLLSPHFLLFLSGA